MNVAFNSALKQSAALRKDLSPYTSTTGSPVDAPPPATLSALSTLIASFARTLDEYAALAHQELVIAKKEKALDRLQNFQTELSSYRSQLASLRSARDESQHLQNRSELLGRRPYAANTPDVSSQHGHAATQQQPEPSTVPANRYGSGGVVGGEGSMSLGSNDYNRESHAFREQAFFASTNSALDEYIARGQAVLGDLGSQREMLKDTQRKLYSVAGTLGISGDTIRMIDRRARQDKWIFWGGVVVFLGFVWLCLHFLR